MASGKTETINLFDRMMRWRKPDPRPKRDRDRSLSGKKRIRARREARR